MSHEFNVTILSHWATGLRPSLDPDVLGIARATTEDLLAGESGPVRDAVVLNAGAALAVYDAPEVAVEEALAAGIARAAEAIDSGAAQASLELWVAASSR